MPLVEADPGGPYLLRIAVLRDEATSSAVRLP
jgi:hypothetical protein